MHLLFKTHLMSWRLTILFLFSLILAACSPQGCFPKKEPSFLRIHIESLPKTLDPYQATGQREFQILQSIFEGLTRYHPQTLAPLPGVANSWAISDDGLTYTFHLRSDAKWSDGKPVTAQDFFNGWEHLLNPATKAPYAFQLFYLKNGKAYNKGEISNPKEIGMKVKGTWVFEVTLEEPVPYFLGLTAFMPLAPLHLEAKEKPESITNGPFQLQSSPSEQGIILMPNPHYWGRHEVKLAGILFRPFSDFATALKFYARTGIDIMADLPPAQVSLLKFRSDFRSAPLFRTDYFLVNCKVSPLDKVEVRQALAAALNRQTIVGEVLKKGDAATGYLVPSGLPDYKNRAEGQIFDPALAKKWLKQAGVSAKDFAVMKIHHSDSLDRKWVAESARAMWKEHLGISLSFKEEVWSEFQKTRAEKKFQISWGGWYGDYLDPKTFLELFQSDNPQNNSGWSNATYDQLLEKALKIPDRRERMNLYAEAEALLLREAPVIPVLVKTKTYLIQPYVRGYFPNLSDIHPLRDVTLLRP